MKVKIPSKLTIGGFEYRIHFSLDYKEGEKWGWWKNDPQVIELSIDAPPQRRSHTFIHEILHAIDDTYLGSKLGEDDVVGLASGLHQVFEQMGITFKK